MIAQEAYLTLLQGSPLEIWAAPGHAFHTVPVCVDNTHERRSKKAPPQECAGWHHTNRQSPFHSEPSFANPEEPRSRNTSAPVTQDGTPQRQLQRTTSETVNMVHNGRRKAVDIEIVDGFSLQTDSDACHGPASQREWRGARREVHAEGSREATQGAKRCESTRIEIGTSKSYNALNEDSDKRPQRGRPAPSSCCG